MDNDAPALQYLPAVQLPIDKLKLAHAFGYDYRFGPVACGALAASLEQMARKLDGTLNDG